MPILTPLSRSSRLAAAALLALAAAILSTAWGFQYLGGYEPCPLCLEQRAPWWGLIGLAIAALAGPMLLPRTPGRVYAGVFAVMAAAAAYNVYLGVYHSGVEWAWWPGPETCAGTGITLNPDALGGALDPKAIPSCKEAAWRLAGLSMAGYNALASLAAAALAILGGVRLFQVSRALRPLQEGLRRLPLSKEDPAS
jgi:disulfide bond formation protein DsbB